MTELTLAEAIPRIIKHVEQHGPIFWHGTVKVPIKIGLWCYLLKYNPRRLKRIIRRYGVVGLNDVVKYRLTFVGSDWRFDPSTAAFYSRRKKDYAK